MIYTSFSVSQKEECNFLMMILSTGCIIVMKIFCHKCATDLKTDKYADVALPCVTKKHWI